MIRTKLRFWTLLLISFATLTSCKKVPINPADSTPPSVVIKVKGEDGQYHAQSSVNYNGQPIQVMCVVEDPEGVKGIKLQYTNIVADHCTIQGTGTIYNGKFTLGVPPPVEQTLDGSSGEAPTQLPLSTAISGLGCTVPNVGAGAPIGWTVKLVCQGTNWSSKPQVASASTTLDVTCK